MQLKTLSAQVRAKSIGLNIVGGVTTALLSGLVVFFGTPEFEALLMQWFTNNPILGSAAMVFVTTVVVEVVKAMSNAAAIARENAEGNYSTMDSTNITLV